MNDVLLSMKYIPSGSAQGTICNFGAHGPSFHPTSWSPLLQEGQAIWCHSWGETTLYSPYRAIQAEQHQGMQTSLGVILS